ncbi:hypothetical protein PENSPDRAFT_463692 [Peniophora sp. CONT]|nr:hypothetical protein PENSPDRAFT_463692 [Peniophora sp. CONT]
MLRIFPWDTAPLNLRELEICDERCATQLSELLTILGRLELLESFSFTARSSLGNAIDIRAPVVDSLRLSRLRSLTLSALGPMTVALWTSLLAPPNLSIDLTCEACDDVTSSALGKLLDAYVKHKERPELPSLRIRSSRGIHRGFSLELDTHDSPLGHASQYHWCPPDSHFTLTINTSELADASGTFLSFAKIALGTCPQIIYYRHHYEWASSTVLRDLFHPASSNVHTLELDRCLSSVGPFMQALDQPVDTHPNDDVFPALKAIFISDLDMSDDMTLHYIYSALLSRKMLNRKLTSLDIQTKGHKLDDRAEWASDSWKELVDRSEIKPYQ